MDETGQHEALVVIRPNIAPRDATDRLVCVSLGLAIISVLAGGPGLLVWALTSSIVVGVLLSIGIYALFVAHTVKELRLSDSGIRLVRAMGSPREIPWAEIDRVEEVGPREVMLWGWLIPPFPAREMSISFSMHGHFAIHFGGRTVYFPPSNPQFFLDQVHMRVRPRES